MNRVVVIDGDTGGDCADGWRMWIGTKGFLGLGLPLTGSMLIVGGRLQNVFAKYARGCC